MGSEQYPVCFCCAQVNGKRVCQSPQGPCVACLALPIILASNVPCVRDLRPFAKQYLHGTRALGVQLGELLCFPSRSEDWRAPPTCPRASTVNLLVIDKLTRTLFIPTHKLSYRVAETLPRGSPSHLKPRQVAQGTAVIADGRAVSHGISGLSPGKVS